MRLSFIILLLICFAFPAEAKDPRKPELSPGTPVEEQLQQHDSYTNAKGEVVHAPSTSASGSIPDGATARCGDGTYSFSHSRSGTCSRHGGAAQWLR
ncbi:MAG: DUF3761 domain-containing protein [Methylocystis sp.]|uniref:DUF3761 domain-containing protein n=1 Tax=Methylocystis sp. TaxID=1911079 RepID=UPI003DA313AD